MQGGVSIQCTIVFIFRTSVYASKFNISYKYSKIHEQFLNFKFILYSLYIYRCSLRIMEMVVSDYHMHLHFKKEDGSGVRKGFH